MSGPASSKDAHSRHARSKHQSAVSMYTSASGMAESTISYLTYESTSESARLSQFPPPPRTIPNTPLTASFSASGSTPSPVGSSFTVDSALSSPRIQNSTTSPKTALSPPSSFRLPPNAQPQLLSFSSLPTSAPALAASPPSRRPLPAISPNIAARHSQQLSPYDWHDGSSSISVAPPEERMLSTHIITELLSSADSTISSGGDVSQTRHPAKVPRRYQSIDQYSEMTYPPPPHDSPESLDRIHHALAHSEVVSSGKHGDNETNFSHDYHPTDATVDVTVFNMMFASQLQPTKSRGNSIQTQSGRDSPATYDSSRPLRRELSVPETIEDVSANVSPVHPQHPSAPISARSTRQAQQRRTSTRSNKSMKSHVSSFISATGERSARLARQTLEWFRVKPLPPVPTLLDMSLAEERRYRQREGSVALPVLAHRADRLNHMLAQGHLPANSMYSDPMQGYEKMEFGDAHTTAMRRASGGRKRQSVNDALSFVSPMQPPLTPTVKAKRTRFAVATTRKFKTKLIFAGVAFLIIIIISAVVGVLASRKHAGPTCPSGMTGVDCNLNATCVCTSNSSSQCGLVAASLLNLLPTLNSVLGKNLSSQDIAVAAYTAFGTPPGNDCSDQALVIDVSPALDGATPIRTQWAQSALMWSFILSQDVSAVQALQDYIRKSDWQSVKNVDGPIPSLSSRFTTTQLGFTFDFAGQIISEPQVSFKTDSQSSSEQLSRVSDSSEMVLDRLYTAATAMSSMRESAMARYWQSVLRQQPKDYPVFVSGIMSSPVFLPFDANGSVSALLSASTTAPFPPPLSCYPDLPTEVFSKVSATESQVFGLDPAPQQSSFNTTCFADRPKYGVLNYLRLRLPFPDSMSNVPVQAAILNTDVGHRAAYNVGQQYSALPTGALPSTVLADVRSYGTINHLNHVMLDFFMSIRNISLANALIQYVLSQSPLPPPSGSLLLEGIDALPAVEIATFGSVLPADVAATASSFSNSTDQLFFGSEQSLAFRTWAINGTGSQVQWTNSASAPQVVRDNSFSDSVFNSVWTPAFAFFHNTTVGTVDASIIVSAFQNVNLFSS